MKKSLFITMLIAAMCNLHAQVKKTKTRSYETKQEAEARYKPLIMLWHIMSDTTDINIDEYLSNQGYRFFNSKQDTANGKAIMLVQYYSDLAKDGFQVTYFLNKINSVGYATESQTKYNNMVTGLKELNFSYQNTMPNNGYIEVHYRYGSIVVGLFKQKQNGKIRYFISMVDDNRYKLLHD